MEKRGNTLWTVNGASVGYVLKYMTKKGKIPMHQNDDRIPEYSNMSKGLGLNYLTPAMIAWHKADLVNRVYVNGEGGKKLPMARYYKQKLYTIDEQEAISIENQMLQQSRLNEFQSEWIKMHGEQWENVYKQYLISQTERMYKDAEKGRNLL